DGGHRSGRGARRPCLQPVPGSIRERPGARRRQGLGPVSGLAWASGSEKPAAGAVEGRARLVCAARPRDGRGVMPAGDVGGDDAGDHVHGEAEDDEGRADQPEVPQGHGCAGGSPRSRSRARSYSSAVISPLAKRRARMSSGASPATPGETTAGRGEFACIDLTAQTIRITAPAMSSTQPTLLSRPSSINGAKPAFIENLLKPRRIGGAVARPSPAPAEWLTGRCWSLR